MVSNMVLIGSNSSELDELSLIRNLDLVKVSVLVVNLDLNPLDI